MLVGPPGVGKGTQAERLREAFDLDHIATGDLLREHRARGTALGRAAAEHMDAGRLVPDELVEAMVEERLRDSPRFLLDGFPRTLAQAEALTAMLERLGRELTAVLLIDAPDEVVIERIAGRQEGRADDDPETARRRVAVYHEETQPVIDYYEQRGLLHRIDAARPIEAVFADARDTLAALA
ncbi:MAG TPA: adenylate kinase [Solirubrobacter sp.]|nr:adenylate kinase [Solirubrobacter sp.]